MSECRWLIVYDNADSYELLRDYWPAPGSKGLALITTRNHALAYEPADRGKEVLPWDTETGSRFLLHLLSGHISSELLADEAKSAYNLSERLSGHALAISNMCGLIHRRSWTISELLEIYDGSRDFKDGLDIVWRLSFQNLRTESAALLSILCFCSPDSIPQQIIDRANVDDLPESLKWLSDQGRVSEAMEDLLTLALIKRDRSTRAFSIHRLIQTQFLRFKTPEDRQKSFCEASILMYDVFPKKPNNNKAVLYDVWSRCQQWLQHVLHLKNSFRKERSRDTGFYACKETCATWVQCQRFLLEQQNWTELEDLVTVNKIAMSTLPEQDSELYMLSATETHIAQMWARQGRFRIALESMLTARNIKLSASRVELQNVSYTEDHIGNFYASMGELDLALEWLKRSASTWQRWSESAGIEFHRPPLQRLSEGIALTYRRQFNEAAIELNQTLDEVMESEPFLWALAAYCKFSLGRLELLKKNYPVARDLFTESQHLWSEGDKSRTSPFNGAAWHRVACCDLLEGNVETALKYFRDARAVTMIHKEKMVGEHARCLYKTSEALYQIPGKEIEADKLVQEAEQLYWQRVRSPQFAAEGESTNEDADQTVQQKMITEEDYDALVFIHWR